MQRIDRTALRWAGAAMTGTIRARGHFECGHRKITGLGRPVVVTALAAIAAIIPSGCGGGDQPADAAGAIIPGADQPWFEDVTTAIGIDFVHDVGATGELYLPEIMGGGVAMFDADNNGRMDLYFIQCNNELPEAIIAESPVNRFYRQKDDGTFEDATDETGLGDGGYGMGAAVGDIDNSGFVDVLVTNFGPDQLYRNRGDGTFENITEQAGIDAPGWSCSAAFVDINNSGYLDLYITQYVLFDRIRRCYDGQGRLAYCSPSAFPPAVDVLYRNNGDRTFTDISESSGITSFAGAGLGVVCDDFNENGWQDIYVANDGHANNLWINRQDETFVDRAVVMGAAFNIHGRAEAGMGVIAGDLDNSLKLDLFMTHLTNESNTLYRNRGDGTGWEDVTAEVGLASSSMPWTGFGVAAMDTLLRGTLDIVVANGKVVHGEPVEGTELPTPWDEYAEPNLFHFNDGAGRFTTLNGPAAAITRKIEISRGLAVGDLDGDGMLDVIVGNIQGMPRVYRNIAPRQGRWLMVEAIDPRLNRHAIGARVIVEAGGQKQMRTINRGFSYLSSCDPRAHFGLGEADRIDAVEVRWPDGLRERFVDIQPDRAVRLVRGEGEEI